MVMDELMDPQDLESTGPVTTKSPPSCKAASRTQSSNLDQIPRLKDGVIGDMLDIKKVSDIAVKFKAMSAAGQRCPRS